MASRRCKSYPYVAADSCPACPHSLLSHTLTKCHQAGQAIEDAMVMTTLFSRVASVDDVPAALDAYTAVRRDRTQYAQRMSAETGEMIQGLHPEVGLDLERLRHVFQPRWDELWYFDLLQHQRDALAELERLKK